MKYSSLLMLFFFKCRLIQILYSQKTKQKSVIIESSLMLSLLYKKSSHVTYMSHTDKQNKSQTSLLLVWEINIYTVIKAHLNLSSGTLNHIFTIEYYIHYTFWSPPLNFTPPEPNLFVILNVLNYTFK